ncbi:hypothetical protein A374_03024 [Fictibacillus macauensis ZFHKF-1]|uniref:DUF309 domain-containing protein n=2 Tax=Fictibacillus TaxID=1329200 RepID=I8ALM2_9BACL|nr:DUF309 domain-containing protein [Fictibacillus macauensis]EIT86509.1 hypothetical protein A374_03024 [Fictibacillus macauensis ZFHKF-1]
MYPQAYLDYLTHFASRDYFECHEVLEEHWKSEGMENDLWVGLIQLAVGLYHERRGNHKGARRMLTSALKKLEQHQSSLQSLGIDRPRLLSLLKKRVSTYNEDQLFIDFDLPLEDQILRTHYESSLQPSNLNDDSLIHKHSLRDRSDVIQERLLQQKIRQQARTLD